jgi:hypothetical protein
MKIPPESPGKIKTVITTFLKNIIEMGLCGE